MSRNWSFSEKQKCIELYENKVSIQKISEILNRTQLGIKHFIQREIKQREIKKQKEIEKYSIFINPKLSESQKGYIAGIVDGEGCIYISKNKKQESFNGFNYGVGVEVCNSSKILIDFLLENLQGHFTTGYRPNRKTYYKWGVYGKSAEYFLKMIYPYLLFKKNQADIVLKFRELYDKKEFVGKNARLSDEHINQREDLYLQLKQLKQKEND